MPPPGTAAKRDARRSPEANTTRRASAFRGYGMFDIEFGIGRKADGARESHTRIDTAARPKTCLGILVEADAAIDRAGRPEGLGGPGGIALHHRSMPGLARPAGGRTL